MKRAFKLSFILLIFSLLIIACGKDIIEGSDNSSTETGFPYDNEILAFQGLVVDEEGQALEGALVSAGDFTTTSDINGYFKLSNIPAKQNSAYLKVAKNDYFNSFKWVSATEGIGYIKVRMIAKSPLATINAEETEKVFLNGGATLSLPNNGFIDSDGNAYSGDVSVYAYWFDPLGKRLAEEMPGDLRAFENNELLQLGTFGMISVELEGNDGQELNLADGASAELEFPIPDLLSAEAPDLIDLWYFNENTGYWEKDGSAVKSNGIYKADVAHFSFWNCDAPFPVVEIDLCINDNEGNPIEGLEVRICAQGVVGVGYGYTDSNGCASGKIPKDRNIVVKYNDQCGNEISSELLGPYSESTSIGIVTLQNDIYLMKIEGKLTQCMGYPLVNGYLIVKTANDYFVLTPGPDGEISHTFSRCDASEIIIQAYDSDNLLASEELSFSDFPTGVLDFGTLEVCDIMIDEFIRFSLNGEDELIIMDPDAWTFDGSSTILTGNIEGTAYSAYLKIPSTGEGNYNIAAYFLKNQTGDMNCPEACDSDISLSTDAITGELIEGDFSATLSDQNGQMIDALGSYRIFVDGEANYGSISGKIFTDVDASNTFGADDQLVEGVQIRLVNNFGGQVKTAITDADGAYNFNEIEPGDYRVALPLDSLQYIVADKDIGGDDTVDSDFNGDLQTDIMSITSAGESFNNVDCGLISEINCYGYGESCGGNCYLSADATGGFPPYDFMWEDGQTDPNPNCFGPGIYNVTVTDLYGQSCETSIEVVEYPAYVSGVVWSETDGNNTFDQQGSDDMGLGDLEVRFYYSWDLNNPAYTILTNENGQYYLDIWDASDFIVAFEAPDGFVPVDKDDNLTWNKSHVNSDTIFMDPGAFHATDQVQIWCGNEAQFNAGFKPE